MGPTLGPMTENRLRTALELAVAPEGLRLEPVDDVPGLVVLVDEAGVPGPWPVTAAIDESSILVHAHLPVLLPVEALGPVAELVHRVNWGLVEGAIELDYDDTAVRVRAGAEGVAPGDEDRRVVQLLDLVADLVNIYGPALADVMEDGLAPADAVERAEADVGGDDDDDGGLEGIVPNGNGPG